MSFKQRLPCIPNLRLHLIFSCSGAVVGRLRNEPPGGGVEVSEIVAKY